MNHWQFSITPLLTVSLLCLGLLASYFSWRIWVQNGRSRRILLLEGFRWLIMLLLLVTLLRPERVKLIEWEEEPAVVVLNDLSGSMNTRDVFSTNSVITRGAWVSQMLQNKIFSPLEANSRVLTSGFGTPPEVAEGDTASWVEGTDLNEALESAMRRESNLKAVVLLSDGDWNLGDSPTLAASMYRNRGIPIFTVEVGQDTPLPDIELESVSAPSYGLLGEQISLPFQVFNRMSMDQTMVVRLMDGDQEVAQKEIQVAGLSDIQETLVWSPQEMGERSLRLALPIQPGEALEDNNTKDFTVNVRMETLKVLVIDSYPRWEYRYLRNALERDPGVEMDCLLFHPQVGMGGGNRYLSNFPDSKDLIAPYDVIFLGDVGVEPGQLSKEDAELIKGLVEQQAAGLVLMPGRKGHHASWVGSPLEDLIPVQFDLNQPEGTGLQSESRLALTRLGSGHWLTRFDLSAERNTELWRQLPGFYWSTSVEKSRPGSEVLAVHDSLRNNWGRMPLLVIRPHGTGKVLFMGTDSAWRWRRGVEDLYHYRFWSQVVRWMAHQRHLSGNEGIRLTLTPEKPEVGQRIYLNAMVLDRSGYPLQEGRVQATLTTPQGRIESLEMEAEEGGWGVFRSTIQAREAGLHAIQIQCSEQDRLLDTRLEILRPVVEKIGQPSRGDVLQEIARIARGQAVNTGSIQDLINQISVLPEPRPVEWRFRLWAHPAWGSVLLLLLAIYWIARKYYGMV